MTPGQITAMVNQGFNIFCSTCPLLHEAKAKGASGCKESVSSCGGPLRGLTFPDYKGPVSRDRFNEICLVCGSFENLRQAVYVQGKHTFSLCHEHRKAIEVLPSLNVTLHPIIAPIGGVAS